jgi:chemotaxis response regulator CheB
MLSQRTMVKELSKEVREALTEDAEAGTALVAKKDLRMGIRSSHIFSHIQLTLCHAVFVALPT